MPPPGEYTPRRRHIMQAVMWTILAATVALASVVARSVNKANRIELSPQPIAAGDVAVRMPLHWIVARRANKDSRIVVQASEPATDRGGGRTVQVLFDHLDAPASPLQYLREQLGVLAPSDEVVVGDGASTESPVIFTAVPLGPTTGVLVGVQHVIPHRAADGTVDAAVRKDLYAAAVLPSLQVVIVHLTGPGELDELDESAVSKIAAGITLVNQARQEPPDTIITLPAGIELQPPAGFDAIVQSDPNRTDRLFWRPAHATNSGAEVEQKFTAVELVGCYFPAFGDKDPRRNARAASALQTLLLVRDPRWRDAIVHEQNGVWRAQLDAPNAAPANAPTDSAADANPGALTESAAAFPATAYLLPDASGRALLAIFHGGWSGGGAFDQLWSDLQSRIKFLPSSDVAQLEDAGAVEAARIGRENLLKLLSNHDDQWWQRIDQSNTPHVGWSSLVWQTSKLAADVDLRQRDSTGEILRISGQWKIDDSQRYTSELNLTAVRGDQSFSMQQTTTRDRAQLTTRYRIGKSPAKEWKTATPAQFIPGQLLPLLMGQLSPGPMLLKTDSFLDAECAATPEPLIVTIRPGPATQRKADGDDHPMRCVTAEVNGSGCLSRWYFNADGELESIELPAGMRRLRSDVDHIRFDFGPAGPMSP